MSIVYPSALPFKLRALRNLSDVLKTITPANGYYSNLADFDPGDGVMTSRIYRGRAWFGDTDPVPMISILEAVNAADEVAQPPEQVPTAEVWWQLLIQGFVADDAQNPTDPAYLLLADVRKRLAQEKTRRSSTDATDSDILGLGTGRNRITDMRIGSGVVRPANDVSDKAWLWLFLDLRLVEHAAFPAD